MMILGIDPGIHGALALIDPVSKMLVQVEDMPVIGDGPKGRNRVSPALLASRIREFARGWPGLHAVVEIVGVMPREGAVGAFSFGKGCGVVDGVLAALGIPVEYVQPRAWKEVIGIKAGSNKDASRAECIRRWPLDAPNFARKMDDGRADAALIALYGVYALEGK